jgi:hypothetical protein
VAKGRGARARPRRGDRRTRILRGVRRRIWPARTRPRTVWPVRPWPPA